MRSRRPVKYVSLSQIIFGVAVALSCLGGGPALAVDGIPTAEIERIIVDLDSNEFGMRQAAAQRLSEMGSSAFPASRKLLRAIAAKSRHAQLRFSRNIGKGTTSRPRPPQRRVCKK